MHFEVKLNKTASSQIYIRDAINLSKMPWLVKHMGKNIDQETLNAAKGFSAPIHFSLITPGELDNIASKFKTVFNKLLTIHDAYWLDNLDDLQEVNIIIKKLIENYGNAITEEIQVFTGIKWKGNEIVIYPAAYLGGTISENKIYVGMNNKTEKDCLNVLIHELVHINTDKENIEIYNQLRFSEDSKEIAITLITNKIIDALNSKFNLCYDHQELSLEQRKKFSKSYKKLEKDNKNITDFAKMLINIDKNISSKVRPKETNT